MRVLKVHIWLYVTIPVLGIVFCLGVGSAEGSWVPH